MVVCAAEDKIRKKAVGNLSRVAQRFAESAQDKCGETSLLHVSLKSLHETLMAGKSGGKILFLRWEGIAT
jgi:hypothetical protein